MTDPLRVLVPSAFRVMVRPPCSGGQRDAARREPGRRCAAVLLRRAHRQIGSWAGLLGATVALVSAGWSVGLRHRETPRTMRAMPSGTASGRLKESGRTTSAAVARC